MFGISLLVIGSAIAFSTHLLIRGGQSATKKIVRIMPISVKEPRMEGTATSTLVLKMIAIKTLSAITLRT